MKVIKKSNEIKGACSYCSCEFLFTPDEIEKKQFSSEIACPECSKIYIIEYHTDKSKSFLFTIKKLYDHCNNPRLGMRLRRTDVYNYEKLNENGERFKTVNNSYTKTEWKYLELYQGHDGMYTKFGTKIKCNNKDIGYHYHQK